MKKVFLSIICSFCNIFSIQIAKSSHKLTLFYLANDVIQHAKRKGVIQYLDDFAEILKEATTLVKGEKICMNIERVFNIWNERSIYSGEFIDELKGILSGSIMCASAASKIAAEFKLSELIDRMKKMKKCESNSMLKLEQLVKCKVDAASSDVLNKLKDKTHGEQFIKDFEEATKCLETVINALEKEVSMRTELIEVLGKSEAFYDMQKDEAKIVMNAYKNFGLRVKSVKKKLDDSKSNLPSPLPSPPRDAPSPTNSDDGPNLPANNLFFPQMNAFLSMARGESNNKEHGSSLDQRLSTLMSNLPQTNDQQKFSLSNSNNNTNNNLNLNQMPITMQNFNDNRWGNDYYSQNNLVSNYAPEIAYMPSSHQGNYDYGYQHQSDLDSRQDIQPIQSLVSSRIEENKISQMNPFNEYDISHQQGRENFEIADMDLGNSDEEDNGRLHGQQQRTLKVIETHHQHSTVEQFNDKLNNGSNYYNHNISYPTQSFNPSPQLKSIARMPNTHSSSSLNSQSYSQHPSDGVQWRSPRSVVASRYSSSHSHGNSNSHNRNWRNSNRNNNNSRKGSGFRRY